MKKTTYESMFFLVVGLQTVFYKAYSQYKGKKKHFYVLKHLATLKIKVSFLQKY